MRHTSPFKKLIDLIEESLNFPSTEKNPHGCFGIADDGSVRFAVLPHATNGVNFQRVRTGEWTVIIPSHRLDFDEKGHFIAYSHRASHDEKWFRRHKQYITQYYMTGQCYTYLAGSCYAESDFPIDTLVRPSAHMFVPQTIQYFAGTPLEPFVKNYVDDRVYTLDEVICIFTCFFEKVLKED